MCTRTNPYHTWNTGNDQLPSPAPTCGMANWSQCVGSAVAVGTYVSGRGRWGHMDLAGNVWELVFDQYLRNWYSDIGASGVDVASTTPTSVRVGRGSGWENSDASTIRCRIPHRFYRPQPVLRDRLPVRPGSVRPIRPHRHLWADGGAIRHLTVQKQHIRHVQRVHVYCVT